MRTIPKTIKREGKTYRLHCREGCYAIYAGPKGTDFLLSRIVFVPERPFRYTGKAAHERLAKERDAVFFRSMSFPTLADTEARLKSETAKDAQHAEEQAILKKGGYAAQKLRKRIRAEEAAMEAEWSKTRQPVRPITETMPTLPAERSLRWGTGRADVTLIPFHRFNPS